MRAEKTVETIRARLFSGRNPLEYEPAEKPKVDFQGWPSSHHKLIEAVVRTRAPETTLEIGTWKGAFAIHFLELAEKYNVKASIVCVDTWLGSAEHWLHVHQIEQMRTPSGYPTLYETFAANIRAKGMTSMVAPMPMTSQAASVVLRKLELNFDVIHVDAAHDQASVMSDLKYAKSLLNPRGIILADDYGWAGGVTKAVDKFCERHDFYKIPMDRKCALSTSPMDDVQSAL